MWHVGLVGRAGRSIGRGVPLLIPAIVLCGVIALPGIWRLRGSQRAGRSRALIIRLASPGVLPSMVCRHLVRPSLGACAMLLGSSRPNPRPHRLIHIITLLGIDRVLIAQTVPPSWCSPGMLNPHLGVTTTERQVGHRFQDDSCRLLLTLSQPQAHDAASLGCGGALSIRDCSAPIPLSLHTTRVAVTKFLKLRGSDITSEPIVLLMEPNLCFTTALVYHLPRAFDKAHL
jgi:hypothetical protein